MFNNSLSFWYLFLLELINLVKSQDLSLRIPVELKLLPTKMDRLINYVDALRKYVQNLHVNFPADILEIPTKLNQFTNALSALTSKIKKLEWFKSELLADFLAFLGHLSNITSWVAKLKVLDAITDIMNKDKLPPVLLWGRRIPLLLNIRALGKITNYDMLTRGTGPINLKVYRNDDSTEVIYNFKVRDLYVSEWKKVLDACPNRIGTGWKIIYSQIRERIDDFNSIGDQPKLDLTRPLEEQDLIRLK
uniref:Uncharacterized protein n=1 Tax=Tanacetum cinerariifolium TaxID=118510 RepID=A0A6L2JJF0_TANCI|nr:hypothetical protein [Tanacetum cinerariifolium]